jgi:hypothetical protein
MGGNIECKEHSLRVGSAEMCCGSFQLQVSESMAVIS